MILILLGLFVIGSVVAQDPEPGKCPDVKVVPNFDTDKYLGKWYEAVHTKFDKTEADGKCILAKYGHGENGTISYFTKLISIKTGKVSTAEGYVKQELPEKAKWSLFFPFLPGYKGEYWILDTDYTSYAVVWSCHNIENNNSARLVWILTRKQKPPETVLQKAYQALDKTNTSRQSLHTTDQDDCPKNNHFSGGVSVLNVKYTSVHVDDESKRGQH